MKSETADQDKDEQYILDELAYSAGRPTWFEINGNLAIKLQIMMNRKDDEIERLRETLKTIAEIDTNYFDISAAIVIARDALKEKE